MWLGVAGVAEKLSERVGALKKCLLRCTLSDSTTSTAQLLGNSCTRISCNSTAFSRSLYKCTGAPPKSQ